MTGISAKSVFVEGASICTELQAVLRPWIGALIYSENQLPLPIRALSSYSATASSVGSALMLRVFGPREESVLAPPFLVSLGVAPDAQAGDRIWQRMHDGTMPIGPLRRPPEPWCISALWPEYFKDRWAQKWLGGIELGAAWAWCTDLAPRKDA